MRSSSFLFVLFLSGIFLYAILPTASAQNSINGMFFNHSRRPVPNIHVELLDDLERLIGARKTRGSGFYTFQSLKQGIYYVNVRVVGRNFKEKRIRIDLGDLNAIGGVDVKQIDLHLKLNQRKLGQNPVVTGVIFAQNVPPSAKSHFDTAFKEIEKNNLAKASSNLTEGIKIFQDYYGDILQREKFT